MGGWEHREHCEQVAERLDRETHDAVEPTVTAKLGLLVTLLKGQIEKRLHAHFDEAFDAPAAKKAAGTTVSAKSPAAKKATPGAKTARVAKPAAKKTAAKKASPRR